MFKIKVPIVNAVITDFIEDPAELRNLESSI
jgi:hypothetical protein